MNLINQEELARNVEKASNVSIIEIYLLIAMLPYSLRILNRELQDRDVYVPMDVNVFMKGYLGCQSYAYCCYNCFRCFVILIIFCACRYSLVASLTEGLQSPLQMFSWRHRGSRAGEAVYVVWRISSSTTGRDNKKAFKLQTECLNYILVYH